MNEWKNLEVDNLPHDILTGGYEFEVYYGGEVWKSDVFDREIWRIIQTIEEEGCKYRYRKPESKQPTTKDILSKWWKISGIWRRVIYYDPKKESYRFIGDYMVYYPDFKTLESADIPPEE